MGKPEHKELETQPVAARLLLDDVELAPLINVSVAFLRKDRRTRRLLPFVKLGDRVLYDLGRVRETIRALEVGGNAPQPRARQRATQRRGTMLTAVA